MEKVHACPTSKRWLLYLCLVPTLCVVVIGVVVVVGGGGGVVDAFH
jgi:hypothetical protein